MRYRVHALVACWWTYLVLTPRLIAALGPAAWLLAPTLGVFLFTWLGYYRHELWHGYFTGVDNPRWFRFVSYLLFSDPQVYAVAHRFHHAHVHTLRDVEFFCEDYETDRAGRRRQFILELLFGNAAWELASLQRFKRDGLATARAGRIALACRAGLLAAVVAVAAQVTPGGGSVCLGLYAATVWMGSVMTRHDQWVEHLGIVGDGSLVERNLLTRNLAPATIWDRLFLFVNHNEPREHVLHHLEPRVDSRGLPGVQLPIGSRQTTLAEYARLFLAHVRTI